MTIKYNYIASPGGLQELSESLREGGEPNADSCAEGPLPLSPRPMVLTFDYRQRLSLRKYQDCGTSPVQSVSNHPSLSHLQIFATHELSKVFHLTFRGGKIRQGFDTICAGAVQAQTDCKGDARSPGTS